MSRWCQERYRRESMVAGDLGTTIENLPKDGERCALERGHDCAHLFVRNEPLSDPDSLTAVEIYATIKEAITNVAKVRSIGYEVIDEMARNAAQGVLELIRVADERTVERIAKTEEAFTDGHQPRWNARLSSIVSCTCGLVFCGPDPDDEFSDHLARVEISKGR